jgi:RNA recognition motif-containing protein
MEVESSTLFVAELPFELQEADFINLFNGCEGFLDARIRRDKNDKPVGFVDFDTSAHAVAARERFQGHKFSDFDVGLNIHFSRQNRSGEFHGSGNSRGDRSHGGQHTGGGGQPHGGHLQTLFPSSAEMPPTTAFYAMQPTFSQPTYPAFMQNLSQMYPSLPPDASNTLYVEGVPTDATEREVSHIFRPYAGFSSLRILQKESKQYPNRVYFLCFVEFDNKFQATAAMHALQGYRMDKNDTKGLHISYAKTDRKERRRLDGQEEGDRPQM